MATCNNKTIERFNKVKGILAKQNPGKTESELLEAFWHSVQMTAKRRSAGLTGTTRVSIMRDFAKKALKFAKQFDKGDADLIFKDQVREAYNRVFPAGKKGAIDLFTEKWARDPYGSYEKFKMDRDVRQLSEWMDFSFEEFEKQMSGEAQREMEHEAERRAAVAEKRFEERKNRIAESFGFGKVKHDAENPLMVLRFNKEYFKNIDQKNKEIGDLTKKTFTTKEGDLDVVKSLKPEGLLKTNLTVNDLVLDYDMLKTLHAKDKIRFISTEYKDILDDPETFYGFFDALPEGLKALGNYMEFTSKPKIQISELLLELKYDATKKVDKSWKATEKRNKIVEKETEEVLKRRFDLEKNKINKQMIKFLRGQSGFESVLRKMDIDQFELLTAWEKQYELVTPEVPAGMKFGIGGDYYDEKDFIEDNSYFVNKETGEEPTMQQLSDFISDYVYEGSAKKSFKKRLRNISVSKLKSLKNALPSSTLERIIEARAQQRKINEVLLDLDDKKKDIKRVATSISMLSRLKPNEIDESILDNIYTTHIENASKYYEAQFNAIEMVAKELLSKYKPDNITSYQKVMEQITARFPEVYFIDATENRKSSIEARISHEQMINKRNLFLTANMHDGSITLNAVPILIRDKKGNEFNALSQVSQLMKINLTSKKGIKVVSLAKEGTEYVNYRSNKNEGLMASFVKREIERRFLPNYHDLAITRKLEYAKKMIERDGQILNKKYEELEKEYSRVRKSEMAFLEQETPELIQTDTLYTPKDEKSIGKFIIKDRKIKSIKNWLGMTHSAADSLSKKRLNTINYEQGSMKRVTISNTSKGLNLKFINDRVIERIAKTEKEKEEQDREPSKPAIFDMYIDKDEDGNMHVSFACNELNETPKMMVFPQFKVHSLLDAVYNYNKSGTTRNQDLIKTINEDIHLINETKLQEVMSQLYHIQAKKARNKREYVDAIIAGFNNPMAKTLVQKISKIPEITNVKELDDIVQKVSLAITDKFNNIDGIPPTKEEFDNAFMIAQAIVLPKLIKGDLEINPERAKNAMVGEKIGRQHNIQWVQERIEPLEWQISWQEHIADERQKDIDATKLTIKTLEKQLADTSNNSENILSLFKKIQTYRNELKQYAKEKYSAEVRSENARRQLDFVRNGIGTPEREAVIIQMFNEMVSNKQWESGTKSYKPGKREGDEDILRYQDNVTQFADASDMETDFYLEHLSEDSLEEDNGQLISFPEEAGDKTSEEAISADRIDEDRYMDWAKEQGLEDFVNVDDLRLEVDELEKGDKMAMERKQYGAEYNAEGEADVIAIVPADTSETREPIKSIDDLKANDIRTLSRIIRKLDWLTKHKVKRQDIKEWTFNEQYGPAAFEQQKEATGNFSINKHPELFEAGRKVYELMKPFIDGTYAKSPREIKEYTLTNPEPSSRYSEETKDNKEVEC